jgi:hypothetical protein
MKFSFSLCCVLGLLSFGCIGTENEQCTDHSAKYHSEALSLRLTKNGVAHVVKPGQGICFDPKNAAQVEKSSREVDHYFYEVVRGLTDSCEEKAIVTWAEREKLRYEVFESFDADRKPSGRRLFTIYSISEEDRDINQRKLWNKAPLGVRCSKSKSK